MTEFHSLRNINKKKRPKSCWILPPPHYSVCSEFGKISMPLVLAKYTQQYDASGLNKGADVKGCNRDLGILGKILPSYSFCRL